MSSFIKFDNFFKSDTNFFKSDQNVSSNCSSGQFPSAAEFYEGLGGYAIALYVTSGLTVAVLLAEFIILVFHFLKVVPGSRRIPTLWVNSCYLVVAISTLFCVALPQATDFVWLFYRAYLSKYLLMQSILV